MQQHPRAATRNKPGVRLRRKEKSEYADMGKYASLQQTATLCNCTPRHINNLFKKYGAEGKVGRGQYDLKVFLPWYIKFLRAGQKSEDEISAKERIKNIKADREELDFY